MGNATLLNSKECDFDGKDCYSFHEKYPQCIMEKKVYNLTLLSNGECNFLNNNNQCFHDGGDCIGFNVKHPNFAHNKTYSNCDVPDANLLGDGKCNLGKYNIKDCDYDLGDCKSFNENVTNYNVFKSHRDCEVDDASKLGNGICNKGSYNTKECEFDFGDCLNKTPCEVENEDWIGDGYCDLYGGYNTEECGWDGGDCTDWNEKHPQCEGLEEYYYDYAPQQI